MDVIMPQLGETVEEGTVSAWHKKVGEKINVDDPLFEVETDKVTTEVPSLVAGTLKEILVQEGETVKVNTRLAVIDTGEGSDRDADASEEKPKTESKEKAAKTPANTSSKPHALKQPDNSESSGKKLSPAVRRLLDEHNLDPEQITGTGRNGRIQRKDVLDHLNQAGTDKADTPVSGTEADEIIPFSKQRKQIAENMVRSKATSAHVLQAVEVDFSRVEQARAKHGQAWKQEQGFSLTYLPFIARALCLAIADYPRVNATIKDEQLVVHNRIHLGIAVDLGEEGLMVPVIRNAGGKSVAELARAVRDLADKVRNGRISPDEVSGGTYTLTNNGARGTLITAPIIQQPQIAILSSDGIRKRPVVVEGEAGDAIAIHPVGVVAQSFDHRAIDGAYSGAFLNRLRHILEETDWTAGI